MKVCFKDEINRLKARNKKRERHRRRRKKWKKHINRFSKPKTRFKSKTIFSRFNKRSSVVPLRSSSSEYEVLKAPKNFSLIHNPIEVLEFFDLAKRHLSNFRSIILDFSAIENITSDAIAVL